MNTLTFFIHGVPKPGGSKRGFAFRRPNGKLGVSMTDASGQAGKDWRGDVKSAALAEMRVPKAPFPNPGGALRLLVEFRMPRPKSHYRKDGTLKPGMPVYHTIKPDTTKLLRSLEDALTGILWNDDAQIAVQSASKSYADPGWPSGATVTLTDIEVIGPAQQGEGEGK